MKKKLCLLLMLPMLAAAQVMQPSNIQKLRNYGIQWTTGLNWEQVKAKARTENKYIFLDCFTTWCGPCKQMDKSVYTDSSLGDFFNKNFISVKVQMDKTSKDDEWVRNWYNDANVMVKEYRILAYPSFVFLSPDGIVVHKDEGFRKPEDLVSLGKIALEPARVYKDRYKEYDESVANYRKGKKNYDKMNYLIKTADKLGETELKKELIADYYSYLQKLNKKKIYKKDHLEFLVTQIKSSSDKLFGFFYPNGDKVNKLMNNATFSQKAVDRIIRLEIINPFLKLTPESLEPDWAQISSAIAAKYKEPGYAERNTIELRLKWFEIEFRKGNYEKYRLEYVRSRVYQIDNYPDTTNELWDAGVNNFVFEEIFQKSNDIIFINKAIKWMEEMIYRTAKRSDLKLLLFMTSDTYANLLYKASRKAEAITVLENAIGDAEKLGVGDAIWDSYIKQSKDALSKMRQGKPTWY